MTGFHRSVKFVRPGDAGTAGVVGTPDRAIHENTLYLKERLDASEAGTTLFWYGVRLDPSLLVGQPAFWNKATQRFEPALAKADLGSNGYAAQGPESTVVGLVFEKDAVDSGVLFIGGIVPLDLTLAVDANLVDGRYYLSGTTPGKLTATRPGVAIPVCYKIGDFVLLTPTFRDFAEDHVHFSFKLVPKTAGHHVIPAGPGHVHQITSPNALLPGWLPANHTSFDGLAPPGAAFGYNLAAHPELQGTWPPIPVESARIVLDKGENYVGGTEIPLGPYGLAIIDRHGIWWMSNVYGDVPWPTNYNDDPQYTGPSASLEYPRVEDLQVTIDFVRMSFATQHSVVTSLKSGSDKLTVVDCDGDGASTGDLVLDLNLELLIDGGDDETGAIVIKRFDPNSGTFFAGPVVEGLKAGANVSLTSDLPPSAAGVYHGVVEISAEVDPEGLEFRPSLVRVDEMRQRFESSGLMYLSFLPNQTTKLNAQVDIPPGAIAANTHVKLRMTLLAKAAGNVPDLDLSVLVVPKASATPAAVPATLTDVTFSPAGTVGLDQYFVVESGTFAVNPGDTVFYVVTRSSGDGYSGELGVLRHGLVV